MARCYTSSFSTESASASASSSANTSFCSSEPQMGNLASCAKCNAQLSQTIFICGHVKFHHYHDGVLLQEFCPAHRHGPNQQGRIMQTNLSAERCSSRTCQKTPVDPEAMQAAMNQFNKTFIQLLHTHSVKTREIATITTSPKEDVQLHLALGNVYKNIYKAHSNTAMASSWIDNARKYIITPQQCRGWTNSYSINLRTISEIEDDFRTVQRGIDAKSIAEPAPPSLRHRSIDIPSAQETSRCLSTSLPSGSSELRRPEGFDSALTYRGMSRDDIPFGRFLPKQLFTDAPTMTSSPYRLSSLGHSSFCSTRMDTDLLHSHLGIQWSSTEHCAAGFTSLQAHSVLDDPLSSSSQGYPTSCYSAFKPVAKWSICQQHDMAEPVERDSLIGELGRQLNSSISMNGRSVSNNAPSKCPSAKDEQYGSEYSFKKSTGHWLDEEMDDDGFWTRLTFGET